MIPPSELILNHDGSIYHLNLHPEELAPTILTVGDPDRVAQVSQHFDSIQTKKQKREFVTHTGLYRQQPISVISTGIGTDNIDIVLNELDALANIDLATREIKPQHQSLRIIRIGTSGSIQPDLKVNQFVSTQWGCGFDALGHFYSSDQNNKELIAFNDDLTQFLTQHHINLPCYAAQADPELQRHFAADCQAGITFTWPGFYGPQGRQLRLKPKHQQLFSQLPNYQYQGKQATNFEMETAGILALGQLLGHACGSISVIIANRAHNQVSDDPVRAIDSMIDMTLSRLFCRQNSAVTHQ